MDKNNSYRELLIDNAYALVLGLTMMAATGYVGQYAHEALQPKMDALKARSAYSTPYNAQDAYGWNEKR
jgi:hypothetical protein